MIKSPRISSAKQVNHSPSGEWNKSFISGEKLVTSVDRATTKGSLEFRGNKKEVGKPIRTHRFFFFLVHFEVNNVEAWLPLADRILKIDFLIICTINQGKATRICGRQEAESCLSCLAFCPLSPHVLGTWQPFAFNPGYLLLPLCSVSSPVSPILS